MGMPFGVRVGKESHGCVPRYIMCVYVCEGDICCVCVCVCVMGRGRAGVLICVECVDLHQYWGINLIRFYSKFFSVKYW